MFDAALMTALWHFLLNRTFLNHLYIFTFLTPVFGLFLGGPYFEGRLGLVQALGVVETVAGIQLVATKSSRSATRSGQAPLESAALPSRVVSAFDSQASLPAQCKASMATVAPWPDR